MGVDVHDYDQVAIVTTVQTSKPHEHVGFERFSALGPLALLPLPGEYRRSVVWPVKKALKVSGWVKKTTNTFRCFAKTYGDRAGKFEKRVNALVIRFHKCLRINKRLDALF